jgi:hypothetical protein
MASRKKSGVASGIPFKTNSRFSRTAGQSPGLIRPIMPFLSIGLENTFQLFQNQLCQPSGDRPSLSATGRSGEVAALVMSLRSDHQSPITSHQSPFDALRLLKAGLSLFTYPLPLLTNHFSRPRQRPSGALPGSLPRILTRRFAFGVWHFELPPSPSLRRGGLSSSSSFESG